MCIAKKKTKVARKSLDPLYNQVLLFPESPQGKVLQVRGVGCVCKTRGRGRRPWGGLTWTTWSTVVDLSSTTGCATLNQFLSEPQLLHL